MLGHGTPSSCLLGITVQLRVGILTWQAELENLKARPPLHRSVKVTAAP